MTRIRKRPLTATSSVKPELPATSTGCPSQLGPQSNPSFEDPRHALLCAASWPVKEDRLFLVSPAAANSGHGGSLASAKEVQKQLVATPAALHYGKPYIVAQRGGEGEGLGMARKAMEGGEAKLRGTEAEHQQQYRDRKHMMDGYGDEACITSKKVAENTSCYAGRGERSEGACKERAIMPGSEQLITGKRRHTDPTDADDGASEQPRKMLPLQLILNSVPRHIATAAARGKPAIPNNQLLRTTTDIVMPSSNSTSASCSSKPRCRVDHVGVGGSEQKPSAPDLQTEKPQPLSEEPPDSYESSDLKIQGGSKSRREERGGHSSSDQSLDWPVSSWQGLRRARSFFPIGRLLNKVVEAEHLGGRDPGVNADDQHLQQINNNRIIKAEAKVKVYPLLEKKACPVQPKKRPLPAGEKVVSIPHKNLAPGDASKKRKVDAAAASSGDFNAHSASAAAAPESSHHHHGANNHADSMRCRRKDGRRWQCKAQVVKPGAPFCHYHTLKMREKHATSVARRLAKRLQSERNKEQLILGRSAKPPAAGSKKRQKPAKSTVLQNVVVRGGLRRVAREQEEEEVEEDDNGDDDEEEDDDDDDEFEEEESSDGGSDEKIGGKKQQNMQNSKSRWRKKCKPCIRRLLDIHDRARPAVADSLDYAASPSVWVVHPPSPVIRRPPASPLPECHLNTDPFEWRSDFP